MKIKNKSEIKKMFETQQANLVPSVKDEKGGWDLFSKMLDARIVRVDGQVDDGQAAIVCASLEYLDHIAKSKNLSESDRVIEMRINSPGGSVYAGLAMYDVMRSIECPVRTVCYGMAASMGSLLLVAGDERYASPHARIMIHQPSGGAKGQATEIEISSDSIQQCWDELAQIYVDHTGVPHEFWDEMLNRDNYMGAEKAKAIGLIDDIIPHKKTAPFAGMKRTSVRKGFNETVKPVMDKAIEERSKALKKLVTTNDNKVVAKSAAKTPKQG